MARPGPVGTHTNQGVIDRGTSARTQSPQPGPVGYLPSVADVEHYAAQAAHALSMATGWVDTRSAIGSFLGGQSFSAGVLAGMAKNLVTSVVELIKLFKTLALAEYYEAQHAQTFWQRMRHVVSFNTPTSMVTGMSLALASTWWPNFDREAREAFEERETLFKTVEYAFEHPGEVFHNIADGQMKKYEQFRSYRARNTLAGEFQAGVLFGDLLLDVLLILDGVTAIARIATKIPGLLKLLPRLEELSPILRKAIKSGGGALKDAGESAKKLSGKVYDVIHPTGRPGVGVKEVPAPVVEKVPVVEKPPVSAKTGEPANTPLTRSTALFTDADPAREVMGAAVTSHPQEVAQMRNALADMGVEVIDRPGSMAYSPGLRAGEPGQMIIDPEASYSAWRHEYQHALDDQAAGWGGMKSLFDNDLRWQWEQNAYNQEIDLAQKFGHDDVIKKLTENMELERQNIFGIGQQ